MLTRTIVGILFLTSLRAGVVCATSPLQTAKPVTIAGKVVSPKANASISLSINRIGFEQEEMIVPVDAAGNFVFRFSTYVPTDAWIEYGGNFLILFHPGDSLYVELDGQARGRDALLATVKFQGSAAAINQQAALFQKMYYASPLYLQDYRDKENKIKRSAPDEYMRHCDSLRNMAIDFQESFVKKEKPDAEVATWSRIFVEQSYYVSAAYYPGNYRAAHGLTRSEWDVPAGYYDFLSRYYNVEKSLISGDGISSYVSKYTYQYIRAKTETEVKALKRSVSPQEEKSILFQNIVRYSKDPLLKEASLCFALNGLLEESAIKTFEDNRGLIDKHVTQAFLREPLLKKYQQKKMEVESIAKRTPNLLQSGIASLDSVLQHNKGKVIYIDFWATWCGPCRQEVPYAKKLEDAFSEEVLFLYLCLESNKDAFDNLIKTYGHRGMHMFLNMDQSSIVREKYEIKGIPHYMLIDKDGKVAQAHAVRPSGTTTESVIRELTKQ
jgi:thiol-disulfide isomerase/thioredoxin